MCTIFLSFFTRIFYFNNFEIHPYCWVYILLVNLFNCWVVVSSIDIPQFVICSHVGRPMDYFQCLILTNKLLWIFEYKSLSRCMGFCLLFLLGNLFAFNVLRNYLFYKISTSTINSSQPMTTTDIVRLFSFNHANVASHCNFNCTFMIHIFDVISNKSLPILRSYSFSLILCFRISIVLNFTSIIHFELIFLYGVR